MAQVFDFSDLIHKHTESFVGRGWLFSKIETWLNEPDEVRFCIITGEPGVGKTAIAAR